MTRSVGTGVPTQSVATRNAVTRYPKPPKVGQLARASLRVSRTWPSLRWVAGSERRELPRTLWAIAAASRTGAESRIYRAAAPSPHAVGAAARLWCEFSVTFIRNFQEPAALRLARAALTPPPSAGRHLFLGRRNFNATPTPMCVRSWHHGSDAGACRSRFL